MNNRIEHLLILVREDPNDPFPLYALALEYVKNKNPSEAKETYIKLLTKFPEYIPTYYQAAQFFISNGENKYAEQIFQKGIKLAEKDGQFKTLSELRNAQTQVLFDSDHE